VQDGLSAAKPISDRVDPDGKNMTAIVTVEGADTLGRRVRYAPDRHRLVASLRST
jgi:hypothetical protein